VNFDAADAEGFDRTLRHLARDGAGRWLVGAVAVGLLAYGAYCAMSAGRRRLGGPA
jgi:hypothetical protein